MSFVRSLICGGALVSLAASATLAAAQPQVAAPGGGAPVARANAADQVCSTIQPQTTTVPGFRPVVFKTAGRPLYLHVLAPTGFSGDRPAALFFFGGGLRVGLVDQFVEQAQALSKLGFVTVLADYRVECRDHTDRAAAEADANDAYRWILDNATALHVDRSRILTSGGSSGGFLSLSVAVNAPKDHPVGAMVLFNPMPVPNQVLPPMIIFHGTGDRTIPIDRVREFCAGELRLKITCTMVEYPGRDHGFFNSPRAAVKRGVDSGRNARPEDYADTMSATVGFLRRLGWIS